MKDELSRPVGTRDGDGDDPGVETARLFSGNAFGVQPKYRWLWVVGRAGEA
jgi:hypothetical protein